MLKDDGYYFISEKIIKDLINSKKDKQYGACSYFVYIVTQISKNKKVFFVTDKSVDILDKESKEVEREPGIKNLIIEKNLKDNFSDEIENFLDLVSDVAIDISPRYLCLIVSESEYEQVLKKNKELKFNGYDIKTPEIILTELKVYPFGKTFVSKIVEIIDRFNN